MQSKFIQKKTQMKKWVKIRKKFKKKVKESIDRIKLKINSKERRNEKDSDPLVLRRLL